jgi:Helix-turn-helix domain
MEERGMSVRALARAVHHDPSYLSKALRGIKPMGPALARDIDRALGAGGEIAAAHPGRAGRQGAGRGCRAPVIPRQTVSFTRMSAFITTCNSKRSWKTGGYLLRGRRLLAKMFASMFY